MNTSTITSESNAQIEYWKRKFEEGADFFSKMLQKEDRGVVSTSPTYNAKKPVPVDKLEKLKERRLNNLRK